MVKKPGLLVPKPIADMSVQNSIYVPTYLTTEYRELFLKDTGVVGATSCFSIFGAVRPIEEAVSIIKSFEQGTVLPLLSRLANYMAHNGMKSAERDSVQRDLLEQGVKFGCSKGLKITEDFNGSKYSDFYIVNPDLINGLLAISLIESPVDGSGRDANKFVDEFAYCLLVMNDHVFDATSTEDEQFKHYRFLRQNLVQAPLLGTLGTFSSRIHRFYSIFSDTLSSIDSDVKSKVNEALKLRVGVDFETLIRLLFPLNVPWLTVKDFTKIALVERSFFNGNFAEKDMLPLLKKMSLPFLEYNKQLLSFKNSLGENYFKSSRVLSVLTKYPFIEIADEAFLLLAPHLILRSVELSVQGAFVDAGHRIESLYGPLGEAFERYANNLFARKIKPSSGSLSTGLVFNPKNSDGVEICDALLESPEGTVIVESKFKPPSLAAIDLSVEDSEKIRDWVRVSFTITHEEAKKSNRRKGALWQLRDAAIKLNNKELGYVPKLITPVIILSEEILFTNSLYFILDKEIERLKIFEGIQNLTPVLVLSIGELESITSRELTPDWPLFRVFQEKSMKSGARKTSLIKYLEIIKLEYKRPDDEKKAFDFLFEEAKKYFSQVELNKIDSDSV